MSKKNKSAVALGAIGGKVKSKAKTIAARKNALLARGRPKGRKRKHEILRSKPKLLTGLGVWKIVPYAKIVRDSKKPSKPGINWK